MVLDTDGHAANDFKCAWNTDLRPSKATGESFETWWLRCGGRVNGLHPQIAEQWIFRHWTCSPFCNLPLDQLSWRLEAWSTSDILQKIYVIDSDRYNPESDFQNFRTEVEEPCKSLKSLGTWDYPIIVMQTGDGIRAQWEHRAKVSFCLIEGHQRYRFLRAWNGRALTAARHAVFVLTRVFTEVRSAAS